MKYPVFSFKPIENLETILIDTLIDVKSHTFRKMFWFIPDHVKVLTGFDFDFQPEDTTVPYTFKNNEHYDGILLLPISFTDTDILKKMQYSKLENLQYVDIQASITLYDAYKISNYDDYMQAKTESTSDFAWFIHDDILISSEFNFNIFFPKTDFYDTQNTHVFSYTANGNTYQGGAVLSPINNELQKQDFFCFVGNKFKYQSNVVGDLQQQYNIVFVSYQEENADENYEALKQRFPHAKRVHGVKGIHQAHIAAATLCDTKMFWVVDADAVINKNFNFDYVVPFHEQDTVHVWRSQNPINNLMYGYGGIKLLPCELTLNMDTTKPDMTTSISSKFKAMPEIANTTAFNTDPFNTWKSAFRECAKLASKTIPGQVDKETEQRLKIWCTQGEDQLFGQYCIAGACAGRKYGSDRHDEQDALQNINNFEWLYEQFQQNSMG